MNLDNLIKTLIKDNTSLKYQLNFAHIKVFCADFNNFSKLVLKYFQEFSKGVIKKV
jgi:hypothetical protein